MKYLGIAAVAATLAFSSHPAAAGDTRTNEEIGDPNRMICRTQHATGSRLKKGKICMTAQEWADIKRDSRLTLEGAQQRRPTDVQ
jgi:hypothetical protein